MARPGRKKRADNPHAEGASRLAGRLRQLREQARKTQEEVAGAAGLSVATVHKIETGAVAEPGYFTVLAIVRATGASIADLAELASHASSCNNWPAVAAWMLRDGMAAVRLVDELIGRDRYDPPLRAFTPLDPVMPGCG
jgi:transcriptional regulator with XRE-family HTH domain